MDTSVEKISLSVLLDSTERVRFAQNPRGFLRGAGIDETSLTHLPDTINKSDIDLTVLNTFLALRKRGMDLNDQYPRDLTFREALLKELQRLAEASASASRQAEGAETLTVSINLVELISMMMSGRGHLAIARDGGSIVMRGPDGIKVEGLGVNDVVCIFTSLR